MRKLLVVPLFLLVLASGCGDSLPGEIPLLDFGDEEDVFEYEVSENDSSEAAYVPMPAELPLAVNYVFTHGSLLRVLRQANQDLLSLLEYSSDAAIDLQWVVDVHEATAEAEQVFQLILGSRVPATHRAEYQPLHYSLLEIMEVTSFGSDRLLAASVLVGPSGRTLLNMSIEERAEFESLLSQAEFYLSASDGYLDEERERLSKVASRIALR